MTQNSLVNASLAAVASEILLYGIYLALSFFYALLIFQRQRDFTGASKAPRIVSPVFIGMSGLWLTVTGVCSEYHWHRVEVNSAAALHRQRHPAVPRSPAHGSKCQSVLFGHFPHNRTRQVWLPHSLRMHRG
jgi:ABC-type nickel/cobalt efflux system permease component RcnA